MADNDKIFQSTSHLTPEELHGYVNGTLSVEEVRKIERHLADCNLCADALEGVQKLNASKELLRIPYELHKLARKRNPLRRPVFNRMDVVIALAVFFLILFLVVVAVVMFWKK